MKRKYIGLTIIVLSLAVIIGLLAARDICRQVGCVIEPADIRTLVWFMIFGKE